MHTRRRVGYDMKIKLKKKKNKRAGRKIEKDGRASEHREKRTTRTGVCQMSENRAAVIVGRELAGTGGGHGHGMARERGDGVVTDWSVRRRFLWRYEGGEWLTTVAAPNSNGGGAARSWKRRRRRRRRCNQFIPLAPARSLRGDHKYHRACTVGS